MIGSGVDGGAAAAGAAASVWAASGIFSSGASGATGASTVIGPRPGRPRATADEHLPGRRKPLSLPCAAQLADQTFVPKGYKSAFRRALEPAPARGAGTFRRMPS